MDLIVSDCHGGLVKSIRTQFQGVLWQRCQTNFLRNLLDAAPKSVTQELHGRLNAMLHAGFGYRSSYRAADTGRGCEEGAESDGHPGSGL